MSSEDPVIDVRGLGKRYEVYAQPRDRLRQMLLAPLRRLLRLTAHSYFREFWALRDVSFQVRRGETVAIVGQNGSGKSTLLQLVCGTLSPTFGEVRINGRIAALLELGAGFNTEFSGRENVFLSGLLYGISQQELARRYDSIVEFAEIGEFIDQPVKTYSSGMYVRLAFAIAAHVDADVLVVDEALSVGDVRFTQKCMRFLREFQKTGTLLFVSHDTSAVVSLCSRAVWLDRGTLRMDGPAKETVETYLAAQHALDREAQGHAVEMKSGGARTSRVTRTGAENDASERVETPRDVVDKRWPLLATHGALTRFEFFEFDSERAAAEFGAGGAAIVDASLTDDNGTTLSMSFGGEVAHLRITAEVYESLDNLIFGFYLKDRLGQRLFGDNTFLTYHERPVAGQPGEKISAVFSFRLPIMPAGTYSIDLAVASGSQDNHTQQHWLHDALEMRAADTSMKHGLIGLPMLDISIEKDADD